MRLFFVILLSAFLTSTQAQEFYTATAPSGLSLRDVPALEAEKVGRLEFLQDVQLIQRSGVTESVKDDGQWIEGEWLLVESPKGEKGYAFGAYLLKRLENPSNIYEDCDPYLPCHFQQKGKHYDLSIFNYQVESAERFEQEQSVDTLKLYEFVFNSIHDAPFSLKPTNGADSVQLWITQMELFRPMYNFQNKELNSEHQDFRWRGAKAYRKVETTRNIGRFEYPNVFDLYQERKAQFGLRDTLIDGEMLPSANCTLGNFPLYYDIPSHMLKIQAFEGGKALPPEYIEIVISYGC